MVFRIAKVIGFVIFNILYRIKVTGTANVPKSGGVILCANHASAMDPIFVSLAVKRNPRFIAKKELFGNKLSALFFSSLGAFPVNRDNADVTAYKTAIKLLQNGEALLLFSQGTRQKTIDISNGKSGAAFFGIKAKVPIVPLGITASYKLFSRVNVNIGEPIYLDQYYGEKLKTELLNGVTEDIMGQIVGLTGETS